MKNYFLILFVMIKIEVTFPGCPYISFYDETLYILGWNILVDVWLVTGVQPAELNRTEQGRAGR